MKREEKGWGVHDAVQVRAQDAAAEEREGVADIADGVAGNGLWERASRQKDGSGAGQRSASYLDVEPLLGSRRVHLQAAKPVVQERLVCLVSVRQCVRRKENARGIQSRCARR